MKKWALYSGIAICFIIVVILLNASNLLNWFHINDGWDQRLETIGSLISAEEWDHASREVSTLEHDWRSVMPFIQFSVELEEFFLLEQQFIRLKNALYFQNPLESEKERLLIKNSFHRLSS